MGEHRWMIHRGAGTYPRNWVRLGSTSAGVFPSRGNLEGLAVALGDGAEEKRLRGVNAHFGDAVSEDEGALALDGQVLDATVRWGGNTVDHGPWYSRRR